METIAIFGAPRSGTSWLGQIFNSHPDVAYRFQPLFSYAFKDRITLNSNRLDIIRFHQDLLETNDGFVLQNFNISGNKIDADFIKKDPTHLVWKEVRYLHLMEKFLKESDLKIIGIVRHPCAVLNSWFNAPKEFDPSWNLEEEWRQGEKKNKGRPEEFYGYIKWKEATSSFLELREEFPDRVKLLVYEELSNTTEKLTKELFSFCGLNYAEQTKKFLEKSGSTESKDPYGVYRKAHNPYSWKNLLDKHIIKSVETDPEFQRYNSIFKWE